MSAQARSRTSQEVSIVIPFGLIGCDFRVASSRWRSAVVLTKEERVRIGQELIRGGIVDGFATVDTCNRNEWLFAAPNAGWAAEILRTQMLKRWQALATEVPRPYMHIGDDAVRHILRVAAGLESFVVGERQITTQLNRALERARQEGTSCLHLNGLGAIAARVAREVHARHSPAGLVRGIHEVTARAVTRRVRTPGAAIVVGAGEIGRRVAASLQEMCGFKVTILNRTERPHLRPLSDLPSLNAQVLVACTAAPAPIIHPSNLPKGPMLLIDIGIPSQIDGECASVPGYARIDLDDLLAEERLDPVAEERLGKAGRVVEDGVREYVQFCMRRRFVNVLDATRKKHDEFITRIIPEFLATAIPDASAQTRSDIEYRLCGLIRQYTNSIFQSINESIEPPQNGVPNGDE